ncbi:hypothetical protein GUA87_11590 [Sneathiella sp. P13V-1]|uniref:enoyl-CoA hydratase/isomerase family protein n=1 Tax=Sneathiella sp. P13V-1 TaxID=2697366 RepID=UPI00187B72EB|nr:enoyl-CoA hydratase-related protein [Sneathiella sp. P13V-1]MBE7637489.1 hypothetical protein [Sneathiella sp. P13V-1]
MARYYDEVGVRIIEFTEPDKRNPVGTNEFQVFEEALNTAVDNKEINAVLIRSEGPTFCAGNRKSEFVTDWPQAMHGHAFRFFKALHECELPIVAAVQGGAVGGGATMLLHCDMVIMSEKAYLQYPFIQLGVVPEGASTRLLLEKLGLQRAMDILLMGRRVGADEAVSLGLASQVVDQDELENAVKQRLDILTQNPREAMIQTKNLVKQSLNNGIAPLMEQEIQLIGHLIEKQQADDGSNAFETTFGNKS